MKNIFVILSLILNFIPAYSQQGVRNILDLQSDIQFLKDSLPTKHPNLYFYQSKEDFENRLDAIADEKNLLNNDELQIQIQLREAIAAIGDPHTSFGFYDIIDKDGFYPLDMFSFSDGMWIIGADSAYKSTIGKKVIAINDIPIEKIIEKVSNIFPKNEPYFMQIQLAGFLIRNGILKSYGITKGNSAIFTFENTNGSKDNTQIPAIKEIDEERLLFVKNTPYSWEYRININDNNDNFFRLKYFDEDSILFIQYNNCWSRELEEQFGNKETAKTLPSFNEFKNKIFDTLANKSVKKLLFDMRFNGGGNSYQGKKLIEELSKIESINQNGKLFVATSNLTFSSAVMNAMHFRQMTNAILIGQPTGGRPNQYGEVRPLQLPKTGWEVYHSTKYYKFIEEELDAVIPDVIIETNYSDILNGSDPIYEYVKKY